MERRVIGISGSLIWSKTLMQLTFNPCGEFRWSPEGSVSQIQSPHLNVVTPGIFSHILTSVKLVKREWGAESNRKLPHLFIPSKIATWSLSFQWKICLWTELQPWFLHLQWKTCPWAEHWWWWWWHISSMLKYCLWNANFLRKCFIVSWNFYRIFKKPLTCDLT